MRMGIDSQVQPVLSLGMGTSEVKLLELVSAYGTLANKGIRVTPMSILKIEDKNGNVLEENVQGREQVVLSEESAAVTVNLMQSVLDMRAGENYAVLTGYRDGLRARLLVFAAQRQGRRVRRRSMPMRGLSGLRRRLCVGFGWGLIPRCRWGAVCRARLWRCRFGRSL